MDLDKLKYDNKGLIPAILQDIDSKEVLMLGYMNQESIKKTLATKKACFWSRSRQQLWLKGETSGNYQKVEEIRLDCDQDTLLILVKPQGPICHTGKDSCFYQNIEGTEIEKKLGFREKALFLKKLYEIIQDRKLNPQEGSYTNYLLQEGVDKVCKKIGEEAAEVIIGAKNEVKEEIIYELADLIYHILVLLNIYNISIEEVLTELENRA